MQTIDVLRLARDHNIQLELHGDRVRMTALRKPPDDLLAELRGHKAEIIALLSRGPAESSGAIQRATADAPLDVAAVASPVDIRLSKLWHGEDYKALFDERAAIAEFDGGLTRSTAEEGAVEFCVAMWLNRRPADSAAGHCAWCGNPESTVAAVVPFGVGEHHTWLHPRCWPAWHRRRRANALAALRSMGIPVPGLPQPPERNAAAERRYLDGLRMAADQRAVPPRAEAGYDGFALAVPAGLRPKDYQRRSAMTDMTDDENQLIPSGSMTIEQFRADRKAAGRAIDVATCEIDWFEGYPGDPYGIGENPITDADQEGDGFLYQVKLLKGHECFVRSPESGGHVWTYDLPKKKRRALRDRIAVEDALYSAARQTRAFIDVKTMVVERFRRMFPERAREIEAAVCEEVIERFKQIFPERAREIEAAVREEVIERFRWMFPERTREIEAREKAAVLPYYSYWVKPPDDEP
jgi:hypothetical protein